MPRAVGFAICYHTARGRLAAIRARETRKMERLELKAVVQKYVAVAGGYGKTVSLESLGFSREEIESVFSAFDEDYHISRFFPFSVRRRGRLQNQRISAVARLH